MTEYKYTTEPVGPVFLAVTFTWPENPNICDGHIATGWVNVGEIVSIRPMASGEGSILSVKCGQSYTILERPGEVMERLRKWNKKRN